MLYKAYGLRRGIVTPDVQARSWKPGPRRTSPTPINIRMTGTLTHLVEAFPPLVSKPDTLACGPFGTASRINRDRLQHADLELLILPERIAKAKPSAANL